MVFQAAALIPFLDVPRNLGWGLRVQHRPEPEVRERVSRPGPAAAARAGCCPAAPASCPAASAGWSASAARWCRRPTSSCSTSRSATSTRCSGPRSDARSSRSSGPSASPTFYVTHDQAEGLAVADRIAAAAPGRRRAGRHGRGSCTSGRWTCSSPGSSASRPIGLLPARLVSAGGQAGLRGGHADAAAVAGGSRRRWSRTWATTWCWGCGPRTCTAPRPGPTPDTVTLDGVVTRRRVHRAAERGRAPGGRSRRWSCRAGAVRRPSRRHAARVLPAAGGDPPRGRGPGRRRGGAGPCLRRRHRPGAPPPRPGASGERTDPHERRPVDGAAGDRP